MYYVTVLLAAVSGLAAARLIVGLVARIGNWWVRRLVYWLVVLPLAILASGFAFVPVSDDQYFIKYPSSAAAVATPLIVFNFAILFIGVYGFRTTGSSVVPRARSWNVVSMVKWLGMSITLTLLATLLFDWELRVGLRHLQEASHKRWTAFEVPDVSEQDNAALVYLELEQWRELLQDWKAEYEDVAIEDIDYKSEQVTRMMEECEPAFAALRRGASKPGFYFPRDYSSPDSLANDEPLQLLRHTLQLFHLSIMVTAKQGQMADAIEDVRMLMRVAIHFDYDTRMDGRVVALAARTLATESIQAILRAEETVATADLLSLIDEQHNPRSSLPELFAWAEVEHVTTICDLYLGTMSEEYLGTPLLSARGRRLAFTILRLLKGRDEIAALRNKSIIFSSFANRVDDPTATSEALYHELRGQFPQGMLDGRDFLYGWVVDADTQQKLINTMLATALYQRQYGRYPNELTDLIPEFLDVTPIDLDEGKAIGLRPFGDGVILFSNRCRDTIEREVSSFGTIREHVARDRLNGTVFLGEAWDLVINASVDANATDNMQSEITPDGREMAR